MSKVTDSFKIPTFHSDEELISLLDHSDKQYHDGKAKVASKAISKRIGVAKGKLQSPKDLDKDNEQIEEMIESL